MLTEVTKRTRHLVESPGTEHEAEAEAQMGRLNADNPIAVAMAFFSLVTKNDLATSRSQLESLCTPESIAAWGDFSDVRELLRECGMATFPHYPAPGVAYVKFPRQADVLQQAQGPELTEATIMTLQNRQELNPPGWRVHGLGPPFPPDTLPSISL